MEKLKSLVCSFVAAKAEGVHMEWQLVGGCCGRSSWR